VLYFPNAGTTKHGKPYEMQWTDSHGNVQICNIYRPDTISQFFEESNKIDSHNQLRQDLLALEKCWVAQGCWFHLHMTIAGIHATDMFCIASLHDLIPKGGYPINEFIGVLSQQLLDYAKQLESKWRHAK
jgi:hypothetical protein